MANVKSETLDKYLIQVRRIAESREEGAEKKIKKLYRSLVKDLNGFLGDEYAKYAEDDALTYSVLQRKGEYARFLEEVNKRVDGIEIEVKAEVEDLINETYEKCWQGMIDGVQKSVGAAELHKEFKAIRAIRPEVVKAAAQNPIPKLKLNPVMERSRKKIIYNIKREIGVGLSQGDRMSTMARRISDKVDIGYRQSMLIARTEAHRVRETGLNDAANEVDEILKKNGSEYRKIKIWNTCEDASVRDTHKKMDNKAVLQDEKFELPSGATAECPGSSGVAAEDCNCRCFLTHDIVTDEEFYEMTGRHFPEYEENSQKRLTNAGESDKIEKNIQIGRSVGAAAFRDDVLLPNGAKGKIKAGSKITKVVTFAGKGTNKELRVARFLENQYDVPAKEWKHSRGDGYVICDDGIERHAELHWFESNETGRIKMKVKRYFKQ